MTHVIRVPDIIPSQEKKLREQISFYHGSFLKQCKILTETV